MPATSTPNWDHGTLHAEAKPDHVCFVLAYVSSSSRDQLDVEAAPLRVGGLHAGLYVHGRVCTRLSKAGGLELGLRKVLERLQEGQTGTFVSRLAAKPS